MRKVAAAAASIALALALAGCGGEAAQPEAQDGAAGQQAQEPEPNLSLDGVWSMDGSDGTPDAITMIIDGDAMEVSFNVDGDAMLYWAGTYEQPTSPEDAHSWTSENDKERTGPSLLGSTADTKAFEYEGGVISFEVTMAGETAVVEMTKAADEVAERVVEEAAPSFAVTLGEGAVVTDSYVDGEALVVAATWTNNSDETCAFDIYVGCKAFQNGVELETAYLSSDSGFDMGAKSLEIKPGTTLDVWVAFELRDGGEVTVEAYDLWGSDGTYAEKTYAVA